MKWLIHGRRRPVGACANSPWRDLVEERVNRLYRGDFEAIFAESVEAALAAGRRQGSADKARRAQELARLGNVSKALGALTSGGVLPLDQEAVRTALTALLQPGSSPELPERWKTFVEQGGGTVPPPQDPVYRFELGECEVMGPDGAPVTVDTLVHALQTSDPTTAAGISGLGFSDLRRISPEVIRPLLKPYFGQGAWDYTARVDGLSDGAFYQLETHALIISVRGVALDKTGRGYTRGQAVDNPRPICVGESMRRLAGQCQLLKLGGGVGATLAKNGQYGAAFKNGTDTIYQAVAKKC